MKRIACGLPWISLLLALLAGPLPLHAADNAPASAPASPPASAPARRDVSSFAKDRANVFVLPIRQTIMRDMAFKFHRMTMRARDKAEAVVLDIETPGGDLTSMIQIRDDILKFKCPVYAFVNNQAISAGSLLALASDYIVMSDPSSIGAAYPITATGEEIGGGSKNVEEKILSYTRGEWRKTALSRGHDVDLAMRMTDPKHKLPAKYKGLLEDGQLLTLDHEQSTSVGLALFIATDLKDLLRQAGYTSPAIQEAEFSWSEKLAGFLVNPVVSSILMLVAISAFFIEFKAPGVGVPLAVGLLSIGLFFWGSLLADLASYMEIVIFFLGLGLLALEIFIIPGFGVAGIAGLFCIFGSLLFSMTKLPPGTWQPLGLEAFRTPLYALAGTMVGAIPTFWLLSRILPSTPLYHALVSDPAQTETARLEREIKSAPPRWTGKSGVALTDLRPVGVASIEDERVNVVTRGDYIEKGARVRAVGQDGNLVVVAPDEAG